MAKIGLFFVLTFALLASLTKAELGSANSKPAYDDIFMKKLCTFIGATYVRSSTDPMCWYTWCHGGHPFRMQCPPGRAVSEHFYWSQSDPCTEIDTAERCVVGFLKKMHLQDQDEDEENEPTVKVYDVSPLEYEAADVPDRNQYLQTEPEVKVYRKPEGRSARRRSHIVESVARRRRLHSGDEYAHHPQGGSQSSEPVYKSRVQYQRQARYAFTTSDPVATTSDQTEAPNQYNLLEASKLVDEPVDIQDDAKRAHVLMASDDKQDKADREYFPETDFTPQKEYIPEVEYLQDEKETKSGDEGLKDSVLDDDVSDTAGDNLPTFKDNRNSALYDFVNTHVVEEM